MPLRNIRNNQTGLDISWTTVVKKEKHIRFHPMNFIQRIGITVHECVNLLEAQLTFTPL